MNTIHERTRFYQRVQQKGESVEHFVRNLHDIAAHCNFGEKEQEHIRDRLIAGMSDKELSRDLQMEQDAMTLSTAVDRARHKELVMATATEPATEVNTISKGKKRYHKSDKSKQQSHKEGKHKCQKCGYTHRSNKPEMCPAKGKTCKKCSKLGHFASVCRNTQKKVQQVNDDDEEEEHFFGAIDCDDADPPWRISLKIGKSVESFKIDTGADVSIMSFSRYLKLVPKPQLKEVKTNLNSPGGPLSCKGQCWGRLIRRETKR